MVVYGRSIGSLSMDTDATMRIERNSKQPRGAEGRYRGATSILAITDSKPFQTLLPLQALLGLYFSEN